MTHYEANGIVIDLGPLPEKKRQSSIEDSDEIPHVVQDLVSVMKLNDVDLLDRLFPDTQKEAEEDVI